MACQDKVQEAIGPNYNMSISLLNGNRLLRIEKSNTPLEDKDRVFDLLEPDLYSDYQGAEVVQKVQLQFNSFIESREIDMDKMRSK